jgi:hypothetical protein
MATLVAFELEEATLEVHRLVPAAGDDWPDVLLGTPAQPVLGWVVRLTRVWRRAALARSRPGRDHALTPPTPLETTSGFRGQVSPGGAHCALGRRPRSRQAGKRPQKARCLGRYAGVDASTTT